MLREIKTKEQKQRGNGRKAAIAPLFFLPNRPEAVTVGCQACEKRSGGPFLSDFVPIKKAAEWRMV